MRLSANTAVLYEGPSQLDRAPIVALVSGLRSPTQNRKTGDMLQTWILRADQSPIDALWSGADKSVCGGCALRASAQGRLQGRLDRACYVNVGHAPRAVWAAYKNGDVATPPLEELQLAVAGHYIRVGSYGDPTAVPLPYWSALLEGAAGYTGYTHQWQNTRFQGFRVYCMASVESVAQEERARKLGWSTFRVATDATLHNSVAQRCPNDVDSTVTCRSCGACSGATPQRHIVILSHGPGRRYVANGRPARKDRILNEHTPGAPV